MKFNQGKCWILPLGQGSPGCVDRLGNEEAGEQLHRKELLDGKLNTSQQCPGSQEGQLCPGGTRPSIASQARKGLSCSALGQPHLQSWGQFWVPQYKEDFEPLESIQRRP
ncbi:hypothetical protein DUI87_17944 [Hirundo rustica rustica]|uniref:Uncharacterized protein n=1 Tax=Hirundo rustica rustica TaxID=333673 RepID=A0A3M0JUU7_HIRRU|nr:hypothetical protein DUI87_17944 [Hirundo rustica rustica]